MYSPRLYKYRDSYVLYKPIVHTFGTVTLHTLFWYRHTHKTFPPLDFCIFLIWSLQHQNSTPLKVVDWWTDSKSVFTGYKENNGEIVFTGNEENNRECVFTGHEENNGEFVFTGHEENNGEFVFTGHKEKNGEFVFTGHEEKNGEFVFTGHKEKMENLYLQDTRKRMEILDGKFGIFSIFKLAFPPMPISQKYNTQGTQVPFSAFV